MTTQRFAIGTLVGGLVLFFLGYLVFGVVFASFFAANAGTATGVPKMPIDSCRWPSVSWHGARR
jgi:hypothetical protein